jgi:adenylylsulfate kinase
LGFSEEDIKKNNALIAAHCQTERNRYDVILVPIISPYAQSRRNARKRLGRGFYEVYVSADLECVSERDTKGLYRKAQANQIKNLIGFSKESPYEVPAAPDLAIPTHKQSVRESAEVLEKFILDCLQTKSRK